MFSGGVLRTYVYSYAEKENLIKQNADIRSEVARSTYIVSAIPDVPSDRSRMGERVKLGWILSARHGDI